jgi:hypothetical protein
LCGIAHLAWNQKRRRPLTVGRFKIALIEDVSPMPTPRECRQRARDCLQLASMADDFYVRAALIELASDLQKMAETGERTGDADGQP